MIHKLLWPVITILNKMGIKTKKILAFIDDKLDVLITLRPDELLEGKTSFTEKAFRFKSTEKSIVSGSSQS